MRLLQQISYPPLAGNTGEGMATAQPGGGAAIDAADSGLVDQPPPAYTLIDVRTVRDAWREWKEGIGGRLAVEALE